MTESQYFAKAVSQLGSERGMQTNRPVMGANGIKILDKGARVTPRLYERLVQHHPTTPLQDAIEIDAAVSGKNLRAIGEELLDSNLVFSRMAEKPEDRKLLLDCLEAVPLPTAIVFQLTVVRDVHPGQFRYFVATALTAVWLGNRPQAMRNDLVMLAAAGLLHDLGMMHIDPVLLEPSAEISPEQRRQLYSHPLVSVLLLERHSEYRNEMLRAVREHHEVLDGSGYPAGLAATAIGPWGRIVSLAQVVASLVRPGRSHALLRLSVLLRTNRHRYDNALINRMLPLLQLRPGVDTEPTDTIDNPVADPVRHLKAIHHALRGWPDALAQDMRLSAARRSGLVSIGERCARIHRTIIESGVAPDQLQSLDADSITGLLADELSLITRELAWQLRAVEREARRRWAATAGEKLPENLAVWANEVETVCADLVDRSTSAVVQSEKI
ncbi:HD domain-containing phosphohydrolase [Rhodoferax sp.]|uniref:HD-GYP domain-containing protein n=1 Tax=Rhodoferax sp. TaxID=50421 RepID=UPI0025F5BD2F|nr:HD domain-containing phosphohydrolase [Rhodoferax sp.]